MSKIFFDDTYIAVIPSYSCTGEHEHSMLHVFFGRGQLTLDEKHKGNMIILDQNVKHCRPEGDIAFFLFVDPTSVFAKILRNDYIKGNEIYAADIELPEVELTAQGIKDYVTGMFGESILIRRQDIDERIMTVLANADSFKYLDAKVKGIAKEMNYSESYLTHLFKNETGVSLKRYLLLRRVEYVWQKITQGEKFTNAVADAGFASPSHFSDTCRKLTGISAAEVLR